MRGMSMVDADGAELYRSEEYTIAGGDLQHFGEIVSSFQVKDH